MAPKHLAQGQAIYPMPTWTMKSCNSQTQYCNGHGTCSSEGRCECVGNYYGLKDPISCDTYCSGDMVDGLCRENLLAYIGGLLPYSILPKEEYIAAMNLAVAMVNNKSDGWFDQTPQVTFVIRINDSDCDESIAFNAILDQQEWAINNGKQLHGVIGAYCSLARYTSALCHFLTAISASVASYGKSVVLPQISYASSSTQLTDANNYPYFSRVCPSDNDQAALLVTLLETCGIVPYIAVVYFAEIEYSSLLSSNFISK